MNLARNLRQKATYWVSNGRDMFGKPTFTAPVSVMCRWEDLSELFIDKVGQEVTCKSKVFFDTDKDLQGYLFLGETAETDPLSLATAFEIRQIKRTPDLRAIQTLYVVYL